MGTRRAPTKRRSSAKALQAAKPATKRSAGMPPVLGMTLQCAEIRELLTAIPRIWASDPRDPDDLCDTTATREQHRAFSRFKAMQDKLARLVCRLGKKKAHTMPELATLVLALAWWHGFYSSTVQAFPETVINALLQTLCGVAPEAAPEWA